MTRSVGQGMIMSGNPSRSFVPAWLVAWLMSMSSLVLLGLGLRILFSVATGHWAAMSGEEARYALLHGLRFDVAIAAILSGVILAVLWIGYRATLLQAAHRGWLLVPVLALYLMQVSDLLYARESGRHVSYEIGEVLGSSDVASLLQMLPEYWPFFVPLPFLAVLAWWPRLPVRRHVQKAWTSDAMAIVLLLLCAVLARGSLTTLPLSPSDAFGLGRAPVAATALNGAYAAVYSLSNAVSAVKPRAMASLPADEEHRYLQSLYAERLVSDAMPATDPKRMNIIMFFLESWPAELMQSYGYDKPVTPEFDALRRQSLTTTAMISGGHRTIEGVFSTLCSFQASPGQSVADSQLLAFDYHCLPQILKEHGWSTVFFQGGHRNSAKLGVLVQRLGISRMYGSEDYSGPMRYPPNNWGPHDQDLYAQVNRVKAGLPEPYFIGINTTTTHDEVLPPGVTPAFGMQTFLDRKLSVMHFADEALGEFVRQVQAGKTHYPTLLVIVADHTAHVNSSPFHHYFIPFALYAPGLVPAQTLDMAASQRDIAPTVLDLLGIPAPNLAGKSLLDAQSRHFAEFQHMGQVGWIEKDRLVSFQALDGSQAHCFDWKADPLMQHPQACTEDDLEREKAAIAFSHYSNRLLFAGKTRSFLDGIKSRTPGTHGTPP